MTHSPKPKYFPIHLFTSGESEIFSDRMLGLNCQSAVFGVEDGVEGGVLQRGSRDCGEMAEGRT